MSYKLTPVTHNKKLGIMATSVSHRGTCPDNCPLKGNECYGEGGPIRLHWEAVTKGERGTDWDTFCKDVNKLPKGFVFRHDTVGDLAGENNTIDAAALNQLVEASRHLRAYTYTHKPILDSSIGKHGITKEMVRNNRQAIASANDKGFTVNISCDSMEQVDEAAKVTSAPLTVLLPTDAPEKQYTKEGRKVVVCPAQTRGITCAQCMLCQKQRSVVVGFRAHGIRKNKLNKRLTT